MPDQKHPLKSIQPKNPADQPKMSPVRPTGPAPAAQPTNSPQPKNSPQR